MTYQELHQRGLEALRCGNIQEGNRLLGQALNEHESSELWNDWACSMLYLERYQEAESGLVRALTLDPHNTQAIRNHVALMERFSAYHQGQKDGGNRQYLAAQLERLCANPSAARDENRNLILGIATGYDKNALVPFVCSLRRTGYRGDVVLFVKHLDRETQLFLDDYQVRAEPWDGMFLPFDLLLGRNITFYNFLTRPEISGKGYARVLLTDVRDVFFQSDPFSSTLHKGLEVFLEDDSQRVGSSAINSTWVRMAFGEETFQSMANRRISCAGTVFGTWDGIQEYLLRMQILATETPQVARFVKGVDQGLHNFLLHRNVLRSWAAAENGERVFTLGYVPEARICVTEDRRIADSGGHVSALIHQYDRHPRIVSLVTEWFNEPALAAHR